MQDSKGDECFCVARIETGKCPQRNAPRVLKLAELIFGHLSCFRGLHEAWDGYGVLPLAVGCRKPSRSKPRLGHSG